MGYVLLILLQLMIGVAFGFYLSRTESNLSKLEIKLGIATVLVVAGVVLYRVEAPSLEGALLNLLSVASLLGGVMAGEWLHIALVRRILRQVDKDLIFQSINALVTEVRNELIHPTADQKATTEIQLMETLRILNAAEHNARVFRQHELAAKVDRLSDLCVQFARIGEDLTEAASQDVRCSDVSNRIERIAWETLRKMEFNLHRDLGKRWNTIVYAMRTVHTRE